MNLKNKIIKAAKLFFGMILFTLITISVLSPFALLTIHDCDEAKCVIVEDRCIYHLIDSAYVVVGIIWFFAIACHSSYNKEDGRKDYGPIMTTLLILGFVAFTALLDPSRWPAMWLMLPAPILMIIEDLTNFKVL